MGEIPKSEKEQLYKSNLLSPLIKEYHEGKGSNLVQIEIRNSGIALSLTLFTMTAITKLNTLTFSEGRKNS